MSESGDRTFSSNFRMIKLSCIAGRVADQVGFYPDPDPIVEKTPGPDPIFKKTPGPDPTF